MHTKSEIDLRSRFQTDFLFSPLHLLSYSATGSTVVLVFKLGSLQFEHRDEFSISFAEYEQTKPFKKLLQFYGLAKAFKYSQHFLAPELVVHDSILDGEEELFWQNYYDQYSMELFFSEQIDLERRTKLIFIKNELYTVQNNGEVSKNIQDRVLMGVGGGKDAAYAFEVLEQSGIATDLIFTYEDDIALELRGKLSQHMADKYSRTVHKIHRVELEPPVIEKTINSQKQSGIRPSDPAASTNAIRLAIIALCNGYHYITTCNEKSADFGNTIYQGTQVNHQYSKSLEFERRMQKRLQAIFPREINYFSILKPLYEVRIAQGFAKLEDYFSLFNSCNNNHETWCLQCSKCAFVFTILAGFLDPEKIRTIFSENLFEKESLYPTFFELLGMQGIKPLECVGEKEECWLSFARAISLGHSGRILDIFSQTLLPNLAISQIEAKYLKIYDQTEDHTIPSVLLSRIQWL